MTLQELERALEQAKKDLAAHQTEKRNPHECAHDWMEGLARKTKAILAAERALASARGKDHAVPWPNGLYLRHGKLPRLYLRDRDRVTFLAAVAYVPPDWNGKIVGEHWSYTDDCPVLRIEYRNAKVLAVKAGALESHPLFGRGLVSTEILKIVHPGRTGSTEHHLMLFDDCWIEIEGTPESTELWAVSLDAAARHSAGTPVEIQPG